MSNQIDNFLSLHASALTLRGKRAELLANNMANADTPNFKARDIDFGTALKQQMASSSTSRMNVTHSNHIAMQNAVAGMSEFDLKYRIPNEASLDGNTVDTDIENSQFSDNAIRYQASLHFLNKRITGLIRTLKGE